MSHPLFRDWLDTPTPLLCPGLYDALSAVLDAQG